MVVSVEGNGSNTGSYTDNQAAPLTLYEYGSNGTGFVGSFQLPQTNSGANFAVSGEYGSSSEGTLQLSGNGRYLTIAGYGVNANAFNANPGSFSPDPSNTALGQSGSLTGQSYTAVPRVVALIGQNGSVNSSTALYNVFNANNPRSAYTVDGTSFYVSGQGNYPRRDRRGLLRDPWKPFRDLDHRHRRWRRHVAGHPRGPGLQRPALCLERQQEGRDQSRLHRHARPAGDVADERGQRRQWAGAASRLRQFGRHRQDHRHRGQRQQRQRWPRRPKQDGQSEPGELLLRQSRHALCRRQRRAEEHLGRQPARRRRPAEVDLVRRNLDARLHAVGGAEPRREQRRRPDRPASTA